MSAVSIQVEDDLAALLSMSRFEFIRYASRLGIAFFDLTEDEWQAERAQAEHE